MKKIVLGFCLFIFLISCKHQPLMIPDNGSGTTPTDTTTATKDTTKTTGGVGIPCNADTAYFTDILPIFVSNCASSGCHNSGSRRSGYELDSYTTIISRGLSAGSANSSSVYTAMGRSMPPSGNMPSVQIALVKKWIDQGAKNNSCNPNYNSCDTTNVKFSTYISPLIQTQCQGCHNASNKSGNISLSNYTEIKASVSSGRFWGSMAQIVGYSAMPQGGTKLSTCDLNKVNTWIRGGALNN